MLRGKRRHPVTDTPEDSKLTKTKSRWAELGKFLTGMTSRPEDARLPPGQHLVKNWPILDLGQTRAQGRTEREVAGDVLHDAAASCR